MNLNWILSLVVCVPLLGSFLLPLIGRWSEKTRNGLALIFVLASLVTAVALIPAVITGSIISVPWAGFNLFYADYLQQSLPCPARNTSRSDVGRHIIIIGIQPGQTKFGSTPSKVVTTAARRLTRAILPTALAQI